LEREFEIGRRHIRERLPPKVGDRRVESFVGRVLVVQAVFLAEPAAERVAYTPADGGGRSRIGH
jgi:hypothetical protein